MTNESLQSSIVQLSEMNIEQLRNFWKQHFIGKAPGVSATFLRRRIAYLLQEQVFGGHSDAVIAEVSRIGAKHKKVFNAKGLEVGGILSRIWHGKEHRLTILEKGFLLNGKTFRSLSAATFAITGTQWNAKKFWGID